MWWRGSPAFLWSAPPMAWCPVCTPAQRTTTRTSRLCVRPRSKESAPSPRWLSPLLHPSSTSWSLRVRTIHPSVDVVLEVGGGQSETAGMIKPSHAVKPEVQVRPLRHCDLSPTYYNQAEISIKASDAV